MKIKILPIGILILIFLTSCKEYQQSQDVKRILKENDITLNRLNIYNVYDESSKEPPYINKGYNGWYECREKYVMNRESNKVSFVLIYDALASPYNGAGLSQISDMFFFVLYQSKFEYPNKVSEEYYRISVLSNDMSEFDINDYRKTEKTNLLLLDSLFINGEYVFVQKIREKKKQDVDIWFHPRWGCLFSYSHNSNIPVKHYLVHKFDNQDADSIAVFIDSIQLKYYHHQPFHMEGKIFRLHDSTYNGWRVKAPQRHHDSVDKALKKMFPETYKY